VISMGERQVLTLSFSSFANTGLSIIALPPL
jgi:hypothetical protein